MSTPQSTPPTEHDVVGEVRDLLLRSTARVQRTTRASVILAVLIWAGAAGWLWYTVSRVSAMERRRNELAGEVGRLQALRDSLYRQRDALLAVQGFSPAQLQSGVRQGDVETAVAASSARLAAAAGGSATERARITVQIFSRDVDRGIVLSSLRELGYTVTARASTPGVPVATRTNTLWYGRNVPIEDVKLVAYTLLRAGIQLYHIEPTRLAGRERTIQVGSLSRVQRPTPMRVQDIRAATSFPATLRFPPAGGSNAATSGDRYGPAAAVRPQPQPYPLQGAPAGY